MLSNVVMEGDDKMFKTPSLSIMLNCASKRLRPLWCVRPMTPFVPMLANDE